MVKKFPSKTLFQMFSESNIIMNSYFFSSQKALVIASLTSPLPVP